MQHHAEKGVADDAWDDPGIWANSSPTSPLALLEYECSKGGVSVAPQSLKALSNCHVENVQAKESSLTVPLNLNQLSLQAVERGVAGTVMKKNLHQPTGETGWKSRRRSNNRTGKVLAGGGGIPQVGHSNIAPAPTLAEAQPPTPKNGMRNLFSELPPALVLEVFSHLGPKDLGVVACVCQLFHTLAADSRGWQDFYCERWDPPRGIRTGTLQMPETSPRSRSGRGPCFGASSHSGSNHGVRSWRELYVEREVRSRALIGRFTLDLLHGHTAGVRCVRMLPSANLVATGGYDCTVRLWDLEHGVPLACSDPLTETVRSLALDEELLVVGSSDGGIRIWPAVPDCCHRFDVSRAAAGRAGPAFSVLWAHMGPVSCVALADNRLYTGSWDMTIRIWDHTTASNGVLGSCAELANPLATLSHCDWVWASVTRRGKVLSTAGTDQYVWDAETGQLLTLRPRVHSGQAYAVEGTRSGHYSFTAGEDGRVLMFDERVGSKRKGAERSADASAAGDAVVAWWAHGSAIHALAFEDPWLVTSSGDGSLSMLDVRQAVHSRHSKSSHHIGKGWARAPLAEGVPQPGVVSRKLGGFGSSAFCVDIGGDRVVAGGDEAVVKVWDFTQALEIERRVQAVRSDRKIQRLHRKGKALLGRDGGSSSGHKHSAAESAGKEAEPCGHLAQPERLTKRQVKELLAKANEVIDEAESARLSAGQGLDDRRLLLDVNSRRDHGMRAHSQRETWRGHRRGTCGLAPSVGQPQVWKVRDSVVGRDTKARRGVENYVVLQRKGLPASKSG